METTLNFNGSLDQLLVEVKNNFPLINWAIHESDAYFTGTYILGKTETQKITIEVEVECESYEVAIS